VEVGLSPGHIVLDGNPAPQMGTAPATFGPCLLWLNGRPSQLLLSTCYDVCFEKRKVEFWVAVLWRQHESCYKSPFSEQFRMSNPLCRHCWWLLVIVFVLLVPVFWQLCLVDLKHFYMDIIMFCYIYVKSSEKHFMKLWERSVNAS